VSSASRCAGFRFNYRLLQRFVDPDDLMREEVKVVTRIAANAPLSTQALKRASTRPKYVALIDPRALAWRCRATLSLTPALRQ
jgi:enoyl-CoA hydratase/carnithine racemase